MVCTQEELICISPDSINLIKIVLIGFLGNTLPSDGIEKISQFYSIKIHCTKVMMNNLKLHIVNHSEVVDALLILFRKRNTTLIFRFFLVSLDQGR